MASDSTKYSLQKSFPKTSKGASPYNIQLSTQDSPGNVHVEGLKEESANKASELLMLNHAKYHNMFHDAGFHNHIVHHLCTLWALGASTAEIQAAYDINKIFQLSALHHNASVSIKLKDPAFFKEHLGQGEFYNDYLQFFQDEIADRGIEEVLKEYMFSGDERAEDILGRMHGGLVHPILHLGFGLEFKQPCLIAEALAAAAIHEHWPTPFHQTEAHISSHPTLPRLSYLEAMQALKSDPAISTSVLASDPPNKIIDGLFKRATAALPPVLAQWRVLPTQQDIDARTAEMVHGAVYVSASAQKPGKKPALDFFLLHSATLSVFYPVFARLEWLTLEQRARLLTWKGWMDMVIYAGCAVPDLHPERVASFVPKRPGGWEGVVLRARRYPDDGHTAKFVRAVMNAERVTGEYVGAHRGAEVEKMFPLKGGDWLQIAHMCMDSVERMLEPGYKLPEKEKKLYTKYLGVDEEVVKIICRFVRWTGVEGAWDDFPDEEEKARRGGEGQTVSNE